MERDDEEGHPPRAQLDGEACILSCSLSLDHVGEVSLTFNSDGLSWTLLDPFDNVAPTEIKFMDIYAVELINHGVVHGPVVLNARRCLKAQRVSELYRFTVHGFQSSRTQPSVRVLATYTFGHKNLHICQTWVNQINASLNLEQGRPKNLLKRFLLG